MSPNRRKFLTGVGAGTGILLAGCVGGPQDEGGNGNGNGNGNDGGDGDDSDDETDTPTSTPMDPTNVGMVYATGGLGDGSFNDQAQTGIQRAESELGIQFSEAQPSEPSEFANLQQQFASSEDPTYELVACIGFLQTSALAQNAADYPGQNFIIVDSVPETEDGELFDNVAAYTFAEHEGSYLDSTNVGFVGGVESPLIRKFEAGFTAGVNAASDGVDVQTNYVGDFNDPAGGREAALAMYNSGADIVYHAAGNTGTGVFQAAQDQGRFAIGVDSDQSITRDSYSDVIIASMVKRVDTAVFEGTESVVNDEFEGGVINALGLAEEGVGIVYGQQIGGGVPEGVTSQIEDSRQGIIDGDIEVPTDPDDA